jgi:hypothetical protein
VIHKEGLCPSSGDIRLNMNEDEMCVEYCSEMGVCDICINGNRSCEEIARAAASDYWIIIIGVIRM